MILLGVILAVCVIAIMSTSVSSSGTDRTSNTRAVGAGLPTDPPTPTPTLVVVDRRYILAGQTAEQIGKWAASNIAPNFLGSTGTVKVVNSISIVRDDLPKYGLGCIPDNVSNQEPPFVLVILNGTFSYVGGPNRISLPAAYSQYYYAAVVVDVWAAAPTVLIGSQDGSEFSMVLGGQTPPKSGAPSAGGCTPWTPGDIPYGAILPGIVPPGPPINPNPEITPTIPDPVPTEGP